MFGRQQPRKDLPRFGQLAVELGYARPADIAKAVGIQGHRERTGQPVPLLGEVLVSLGRMTAEQVEQVFSRLVADAGPVEKPKPAARPPAARAPGSRGQAAPTSWWGRLRGAAGA